MSPRSTNQTYQPQSADTEMIPSDTSSTYKDTTQHEQEPHTSSSQMDLEPHLEHEQQEQLSDNDDTEVAQPEPTLDPSIVKIQAIANDTEILQDKIQRLQSTVAKLDLDNLAHDPSSSRAAVQALHKQGLLYAHTLLQTLLKLDEITTSPESRPLRKQQVLHTQSLMAEVDKLNEQLQSVVKQLTEAEHAAQEEQKRREEEEVTEKLRQQQQQQEEEEKERQRQQELEQQQDEQEKLEQQKQEELQQQQQQMEEEENDDSFDDEEETEEQPQQQTDNKPEEEQEETVQPKQLRPQSPSKQQSQPQQQLHSLADRLKTLKFQPRFNVTETRDSYVHSANIPGMQDDDIHIHHGVKNGQRILTIEGLRLPSEHEEKLMRQHVRQYGRFSHDEENALVLRVAAGRFGKFSETYQLSKVLNVESMQATYDDGVLKITIPKMIRAPVYQHQQQQQRVSPHCGYRQQQQHQPQQRHVHPGYFNRSSPFGFFF